MGKGLKISFYILLLGILTLYAAVFRTTPREMYSPAEVLGARTGLRLFIQPETGRDPILEAINFAQSEILVEVYLFSDQEVIRALERAHDRGVSVKIMMEQHPFGGGNININTYFLLTTTGVATQWANPAFALTHEKAIIVDGREVCILNQNLTTAAFTKNREYNVCDDNREDASEAKNIFTADWERKNYTPTAVNLVVSPDNSRGKLTTLIASAQKSLDLEMEVLQDSKIIELLTEKSKTIPVRIITPPPEKIAGNRKVPRAMVKTLSSPYLHAKLLLVDGQYAYVGSVNFSSQSLDKNRELGILISQPDIIEGLNQAFENDWAVASTY